MKICVRFLAIPTPSSRLSRQTICVKWPVFKVDGSLPNTWLTPSLYQFSTGSHPFTFIFGIELQQQKMFSPYGDWLRCVAVPRAAITCKSNKMCYEIQLCSHQMTYLCPFFGKTAQLPIHFQWRHTMFGSELIVSLQTGDLKLRIRRTAGTSPCHQWLWSAHIRFRCRRLAAWFDNLFARVIFGIVDSVWSSRQKTLSAWRFLSFWFDHIMFFGVHNGSVRFVSFVRLNRFQRDEFTFRVLRTFTIKLENSEWKTNDGVGLTASGFLWLIIRWSVFRTMITRESEPQSCDELVIGIWVISVWTALNDLKFILGKTFIQKCHANGAAENGWEKKTKNHNVSDAATACVPFSWYGRRSHEIYAGDKKKWCIWPWAPPKLFSFQSSSPEPIHIVCDTLVCFAWKRLT